METTIEKIKKGDFFVLKEEHLHIDDDDKRATKLYVRDEYNRFSKKYMTYKYNDINAQRDFKKGTKVFID